MNNSVLFFIGIAILMIDARLLLPFIVVVVLLKKFGLPNKANKNQTIEEIINNLFAQKWSNVFSNTSDAKVVSPKNKTSHKNTNYNLPLNLSNMFNVKRLLLIFIIGLFGFMLVVDGFVMIEAGEVGVILDRGKGVLKTPLPTGLHLKIPFWQTVTAMDTRLQSYTMSGSSDFESTSNMTNESISGLTKDGQKVNIDVTVQFYLEPLKAPLVYERSGLDYVEKIVAPAARSVIRNVITGFNSKELFQLETRNKAQTMLVQGMEKNLADFDLKLKDVLLRNIQFSTIYLQSIEEKQIAEQKIQKAQFEKEEAVITKERKIIEAEADAEAIKLKGEALKDSPEVIQLEMINKLSPNIKWGVLPDGVLPMLNLQDIKGE